MLDRFGFVTLLPNYFVRFRFFHMTFYGLLAVHNQFFFECGLIIKLLVVITILDCVLYISKATLPITVRFNMMSGLWTR